METEIQIINHHSVTFHWDGNGGKISITHDGSTYRGCIRKKEKSAFDDLRKYSYGCRTLHFDGDKFWLYYSADVGRCVGISLYDEKKYDQKWYYDQLKYDYTHDCMISKKYKTN